MGKRVKIQTDYTADQLHERYRHATDPVERTHWQMVWLAKEGKKPQEIAEQVGYTARWVRMVIRRWNEQGEAGIGDHRHEVDVSRPLLSAGEQEELAVALQAPPADGGLWNGPKVAQWMGQRLGREVAPQRGWEYLRKLGYRTRVPRPEHARSDPASHQAFKKTPRAGRHGAAGSSAGARRSLGDG